MSIGSFLSGVVRTPRGGVSAAVLVLVVACALFAPLLSPTTMQSRTCRVPTPRPVLRIGWALTNSAAT